MLNKKNVTKCKDYTVEIGKSKTVCIVLITLLGIIDALIFKCVLVINSNLLNMEIEQLCFSNGNYCFHKYICLLVIYL